MRIIFFGSDNFAVTNLQSLVRSSHQVVACVTHPDKAKGRHLQLVGSPVKEEAIRQNIAVLQPVDLQQECFLRELKSCHADLFVVIAYGYILSAELLSVPEKFCVNVHASLLPQYRGAAPINWAILNGESQTGVSIIKMNSQMDAGDVVAQTAMPIRPLDDAVTLRAEMARLSAKVLIQTLDNIEQDQFELFPQDAGKATYAVKLTKELGLIQWPQRAGDIHNLVRGLLPWPCAYTYYNDKLLKILKTELVDEPSEKGHPGEIIAVNKKDVVVAAGSAAIRIQRVHLQGSKPMDTQSFLAGHRLEVGFRFN